LIGIAVRLIWRRRRTFSRLRSVLETWGLLPVASPKTPEECTSSSEQEARLHRAIARLPEGRRVVVIMVEWEGMSGVEVASVLGVPVGTVWRRLHEARAELRRALEEEPAR
jgi:RNA polymerase sigma-70 factor (ECF subfamily)